MQIETKYSVGDLVYYPRVSPPSADKRDPCPDCRGGKTWLTLTPAGEFLYIACPTCTFGYETMGTVPRSGCSGRVEVLTIGSVRVDTNEREDRGSVEYICDTPSVGGGSVYREADICDTYAEAEAKLPELIEEIERAIAERNARSLAHNRKARAGSMVAHYRRSIRDAKKQIAAAERGLAREAQEGRDG